ncbi:MAG: N,N-dimethylformamidase beta subunit family domain-containing protein [Bacteroidota bacterium]
MKKKISRRKLLVDAAQAGLAATLLPLSAFADDNGKKNNAITAENKKNGTTDWQLTYVKSEQHRSRLIEGYCSKTSVRAGDSLDIFLNAASLTDITIDIYRMGYYGGKGGRFIKKLGPFPVSPQTVPPIAENRLRQCDWKPAVSLSIPKEWLSGIYLGKLYCSAHRYESYIIFIVRDDRKADIMFQTSDNTWQAYNKWPDTYSLYDSDPPLQPLSSRTWVSFDRPYGKYPQVVDQPLSQGSGEFLLWEYPLCYWLEQEGYDVTYCSNIDTHSDPSGLNRVKCFLSVGHDEYWTLQMFDNVKNAVARGLSAAFLSGNSLMWVVDLGPQVAVDATDVDVPSGLSKAAGGRVPIKSRTSGDPNRIIHRIGRFGGFSEAEKGLGIMGPFAKDDWPNENTLIGARTMYPFNGSADWIVSQPDHWIFEGTGMKKGDRVSGLVGWEHHGDPADIPGLEVVAEGTTINSSEQQSHYTATVYPGPKGNWVFNAATIYWSFGLAVPPGVITPNSHFGRPHGKDERIQRITSNFLKKCGI